MGIFEIIAGVMLVISSLIIIIIVTIQEGSDKGLGALSGEGGSDSYLGKNKSRSLNATLKRMTTYVAIAFFVLAIAANVIIKFL